MSANAGRAGDATSVSERPALYRRAVLPLRLRAYRAPRWWQEVLILIVLDIIYEKLRNLVPERTGQALNRGEQIFAFTQRLHWDVELGLNHFVANHAWLAHIANGYYSFLHLPVTAGVLIWLYVKHRRVYRSGRWILVVTTILGLVGFYLFPTAPPRLLPGAGFVDTLVTMQTFGSWGDPKMASISNQYAAMPSLHCAWSMWVGLCIFNLARHRVVRIAGLVYPLCTLLVVMGTANHFLLDGLAGYAVLGTAFAVHLVLYGRPVFHPALTHEQLTLSKQQATVTAG